MQRRQFLSTLALGPPAILRAQDPLPAPGPKRRFARVRVSPARVIRTIAGLRPYRPSGFVLKAEKIGGKLVVHNYGHGGSGMTLGWGTAHLAVEEAMKSASPRVAVAGCGCVGLGTARLLQRRGRKVTIYAAELPPGTTSNISGALVLPVSLYESANAAPQFLELAGRAMRLSNRYLQEMAGSYYGVRWLETYFLRDREPSEAGVFGTPEMRRQVEDMFPDAKTLSPGEHPFDSRYADRISAMLIEPHTYLNALLRDFLIAGGRVAVRRFASLRALLAVPETVIMNCTGLGSRELLHDEELIPAKGQLSFLVPQPEVDYCVIGRGLYMFPRTDGILLGGSFVRGDWTLEPDAATTERILSGHMQLFGAMKDA